VASAAPKVQAVAPQDTEGAAGLLADVRRIVRAFEREGWFHEETVARDIHPIVMESVCRASEGARVQALSVLDAIDIGDPRSLYERAGRELTSEVESALRAQREFLVLQHALAAIATECPFWVESEHGFTGRQTLRNKWALHLESGGLVQLRKEDAKWSAGGGGNSRLLGGRGIGDSWSLLGGAEFGGGALLRSSNSGQFTINYFPAIPVVLRYSQVDWLYDLELAPVALFQSHDTRLSYGGRLGVAIGVSVLRSRGFLPWAGVALMGEHYVPSGGRGSTQFLRGGVRVGIRWAP
jgi:hypothetical protein